MSSLFRLRVAFAALSTLFLTLAVLSLAEVRLSAMPSAIFDWKAIEERQTKTGSTKQFFQAPTAMLEDLECHVTTLAPGQDPHPPHRHAEEELYIVKDGTVEVSVNGERKQIGPGSVVFAAANQPHGIRNSGVTPATYHVIKWKAPATVDAQTK